MGDGAWEAERNALEEELTEQQAAQESPKDLVDKLAELADEMYEWLDNFGHLYEWEGDELNSDAGIESWVQRYDALKAGRETAGG
jgi:hypothetical protein